MGVLSLSLLVGCGDNIQKNNVSSKVIYTTIPPIAGLVEKIAGKQFTVISLVPSGKDPHTFEPTPKNTILLSRSKAYFTIGLPLENKLKSKLSKNVNFVDISSGVERRSIGDDDKKKSDPHIWLGYPQLKVMAKNIKDELISYYPKDKEKLIKNYNEFMNILDNMNKLNLKLFANFKGKSVMFYHPSFGYFTDAYGLKQVSIEKNGKQPTPKEFAKLLDYIKKNDIKAIFVQPQFDRRVGEELSMSTGYIQTYVLNPLERDILKLFHEVSMSVYSAVSE
jgi:zinc transport system substrate-binding protein